MKITALDHVQLAIPEGSEGAAREFYTRLGFTEVEKPEPLRSRGGCWFTSGTAILHLGTETEFVPARKAHPAFRVSDLDGFGTYLESQGVEVKIDRSLEHVHRFFVHDPFGNRIEFVQEGDQS